MEPQQEKTENITITPLKKVTPLSKYLALILFIIMPFLGGWIGYKYSPQNIKNMEDTLSEDKYVVNDSGVELIDFSKCEHQVEKASWEGQELVIVLGESLFDKRCHTLIYSLSAFGDGGYQMKECWVPMSMGKIFAEASDMEGKTTNPVIPNEFCTTTVRQGVFESPMNNF